MTNKFNHAYYITGPIEEIHTETQARNVHGVPLFEGGLPKMETCVKVDKKTANKVLCTDMGLAMIRRYKHRHPSEVCITWDEHETNLKAEAVAKAKAKKGNDAN